MTIAIVDDELETRQYMQGLVAQYLAETGRMAQLVFYPDGASFLVGCEHPDIVLMDIDMPGMDGLSTAEQLRRSHPDAILIFTTRLSQCAIRGYEVDAIGFLVKPVTLLTVFVRSVSLPTDISLLDRLFSILSVIMVMVLIYQCMYADEMRREKEIIESLLAREESRHQLLGKTIDSINMKCHDLRYHIDTYRRAQQLDEHAAFFDEVEQEIQRYEYTFHTGNAALDSVLSEKSLYCSANHILLTTMLDVSLLAPIEKSDIYSIFGNALDNAIQAVMAEAPENRSVNIRVSDVVGMTQIVFENFCSKPPEMHEGLPKTEKDTQYHGFGLRSIRYIIEKYDGHMSIDTKDQMFILSLLLPRPQQSA